VRTNLTYTIRIISGLIPIAIFLFSLTSKYRY